MRDIIARFAPAPTGFLHLGHVVNAIYVWGVAGALGGRVLLRIEDHDRQRSRPEYDAAILEDLAWLGFMAAAPPVRQSERGAIYEEALASLRARGLVYACACSRADIVAGLKSRATNVRSATLQGRDDSDEIRYSGTCRERGLADGPGLSLRVRLEPSVERFVDLRHGPQEQRPSQQCGDLVVRDREGNWTYQFAVAVDDLAQGVTLVIRGDDLLASTGRQIQLARLLGRSEAPRFLHHPLILKSPTQKLSKSDGDTGVRDLRKRGWTPESVIGHAAALAGLIADGRRVPAAEVSTIMGRLGSRP
jgi:glutamyl-Q tRNA(Asp) synthetase